MLELLRYVQEGYYVDVLKIILTVLISICSIFLIIVVLLQPGASMGLGSITGGAETFFGKHKAKSVEGRLALLTKISFIIIIVVSIFLVAVLPRLSS